MPAGLIEDPLRADENENLLAKARCAAIRNTDGSLVAVMFNSGAANNNYVVAIGGKKLQFAMPASGWATVKYRP